MSTTNTHPERADIQPLPENISSVQPGSGVCYRIEMAWGHWRRWWLRRFRPGYVAKMAELRKGDCDGAPHEILDSRDLKFCRNLCTCHWEPGDDPFGWRDRLPFARWGLAELLLMGAPLLAVTVLVALLPWPWGFSAILPGIPLGLVVYFFRDPPRQIPQDPGLLVSPADGKVVEIIDLDHDEFIGGKAVRISIFLSLFNVHLNRSPIRARVIGLHYSPGEFLNAMNPESAIRNENMWLGLEEETPPHRRLAMRQISGMVARRIVCALRPGEVLARGDKIGMIKLGSRTELILPAGDDLEVMVQLGQRVKAGRTVMAKWPETT